MAKGENARNDNVKAKKYPKKIRNESTNKEKPIRENKKNATLPALQTEIDNLNKKLTEQEETIDDLVQERDDAYNELFQVRLTLADAWNIQKDTNHEKIWEVLRRTKENSETDGEKETYSTVVKSIHKEIAVDSTAQMNDTIVTKCSSTESGIGMQSITQLIDERVNLILEGKIMKTEYTSVIDIKQPNNQPMKMFI